VIPALLFVLVWLLGYEIVPAAHLAMHAHLGAHTHGATHCHAGFCHEGEPGAQPAGDPIAHGKNSLEHRGVVALASDVRIFVPELMLVGELPLVPALTPRITSFEATSPPARGPPA
jgi:hypothetical protein